MIDFSKVYFSYGKGCPGLDNINFHIEKGEFVAIIGSNGAGKTTLSKLFNGLLKPSSGDVTICGMNTKTTKTSTLSKHIGFLFQNPDRQICRNSVYDEIMFGLECVMTDKELMKKRCQNVIDDFGFDKDKDPFSLSRGERQRVALASLIAVEPEILILDEPTTGLDYRECTHIMNKITELNKKGVTVIMVCHDMELVLDYAKRVLVMNKGSLVADGDTREILFKEDILLESSILPPQIPALSIRLGENFNNICTTTEMAEKIDLLKKEGVKI